MNVAIIVAAGQGTRLGRPGGKQLIPLLDKPVLAHTLLAFEKAMAIDAIVVVTSRENIQKCLDLIDKYGILKADRVVTGGAERQDSVFEGLKAAAEFERVAVVAVHDGARPLVAPDVIDSVVSAAYGNDGAVVGIPAKDTIKLVRDGFIAGTLDRSQAWQMQTPQAFRFDVLVKAHEAARKEGFLGTDDAVLVERAGGKLKAVLGSDENIKITTPTDVLIAEAILRARAARQ